MLMVEPPPAMKRFSAARYVSLFASVKANTGLKKPFSTGVPLSSNVPGSRVTPAGNSPETFAAVYGSRPPTTRMIWE